MIAGRLRRDGYRSFSGGRGWGITALIAGRLRCEGYRSFSGGRGWGITSGWSRFDRVMLVEQTPVGRSYRPVERLVTALMAGRLRRDSSWWSSGRGVRVMLVEQTPVGRGYRAVHRPGTI